MAKMGFRRSDDNPCFARTQERLRVLYQKNKVTIYLSASTMYGWCCMQRSSTSANIDWPNSL